VNMAVANYMYCCAAEAAQGRPPDAAKKKLC